MSKYQWIILLGVWVAVFLFLGFPSSWSKVIAVVTGLIIILVAYSGSRKQRSSGSGSASSVENNEGPKTTTYIENQ